MQIMPPLSARKKLLAIIFELCKRSLHESHPSYKPVPSKQRKRPLRLACVLLFSRSSLPHRKAANSIPKRVIMSLLLRGIIVSVLALFSSAAISQSDTVVFSEPGFPATDSTRVSADSLQKGFTHAQTANAAQLSDVLSDPRTKLLVLPYGSAYPEVAWP